MAEIDQTFANRIVTVTAASDAEAADIVGANMLIDGGFATV
ncbi:MAG: hypothetical protein Q3965_00165 [Rothia sp. (in: high G+C Gram-positive bacteria)]|nr:hypothetical protein [Rothia sp. (in: high G+C Gram-positive bacteria)]